MQLCLLTLIASPSLEDALVDWLLLQDSISGFCSSMLDGHGSPKADMNVMEQVTGRQKRIQFLVHTDMAVAESLIQKLKVDFTGARLHYYVLPVLTYGSVA